MGRGLPPPRYEVEATAPHLPDHKLFERPEEVVAVIAGDLDAVVGGAAA